MTLKTLFRWHLWLGLCSSVGLLLIGVSGSVAVFAPEIDWLVIPALRAKPAADGRRADADAVVAAARAAHPGAQVTSLHLSPRPSFAHVVGLQTAKEKLELYVDPATAAVQGSRGVTTGYTSSVYQFIRQFHVRLLLGFWGRVFVGVFGVTLVLSCVTGLWIYRGWIGKLFTLRLKGGWGARPPWAEAHKFIGVWSLLFNVLIGVTGAVLGLENLYNKVDLTWGSRAPGRVGAKPVAPKTAAVPAGAPLGPNALLARARDAIPDLTVTHLTWATRPVGPVVVMRGAVPDALVAHSHVRSSTQLTLDAVTGAALTRIDGRERRGWNWLYWTQDPLHFGYIGGLATKIIWFVLGLSPGVLALSGTVMWWRRRARATAPASAATAGAPHPWAGKIAAGAAVLTLAAAYALVARLTGSARFTPVFAELWLVKPVTLGLMVFPVSLPLAWLALRTRGRWWAHGGACGLLAAWYLALTFVLAP